MAKPELEVNSKLAEMVLWFKHFTPEQAERVQNELCPDCDLNVVTVESRMEVGDDELMCESLDAGDGWRDAAIIRGKLRADREFDGQNLSSLDPERVRQRAACLRNEA